MSTTVRIPAPMNDLINSMAVVRKTDVDSVVTNAILRINKFHYDTPYKRKEAKDYVKDWALVVVLFELDDYCISIVDDVRVRYALSFDEALTLILYYSDFMGIDQ